jgi:hypothetical protein
LVDSSTAERASRQKQQTFDLLNVQRDKWAKFTSDGKLKVRTRGS